MKYSVTELQNKLGHAQLITTTQSLKRMEEDDETSCNA